LIFGARAYLHKTTLRLPNFKIISAIAIYLSLSIHNLLKLVSKKPRVCQQLKEMKSSAQCTPPAGLFLFGKLNPTKNTPARVHQILTVKINQNVIHENEITKPERRKRRKVVTSALLENHFRNDRLEKKQKKIYKKGREDKADSVPQKLETKALKKTTNNKYSSLLLCTVRSTVCSTKTVTRYLNTISLW
jgi:hypothetical protein